MKKVVLLSCFVLVALASSVRAQEVIDDNVNDQWYAGLGLGYYNYEGDEVLQDGIFLTGRLGYDLNEWWSIEGMLTLAPSLDENFTEDDAGNPVSQAQAGEEGFGSTSAFGMVIDGLFHFTRWKRVDPFLALGGGLTFFGDEINGKKVDANVRAGGGLMYHFNNEWAVRGDVRALIAGNNTEVNLIMDTGVVWYWGAHVPAEYVAHSGPLDSDGDGLTDMKEDEIGTNPYVADSDGDGLSDGAEYLQYKTDPLNKDTDFDGLTDGYDEVFRYKTDPLLRDTDNGGVADGHEVIEDGTNPLDPSDDFKLHKLKIAFDYNKTDIKSKYDRDISLVIKELQRNPTAEARIEGHTDRTAKSNKKYNHELSQRRAESVLNYIVKKGGIKRSRLEAHGYGFSRPEEPNDPRRGNPANRRVEVYISGTSR